MNWRVLSEGKKGGKDGKRIDKRGRKGDIMMGTGEMIPILFYREQCANRNSICVVIWQGKKAINGNELEGVSGRVSWGGKGGKKDGKEKKKKKE